MTLHEIRQASGEHPELDTVQELFMKNQIDKMTKPYCAVVDEQCITHQNILICDSSIVPHVKLREQAFMLEDQVTRTKQA